MFLLLAVGFTSGCEDTPDALPTPALHEPTLEETPRRPHILVAGPADPGSRSRGLTSFLMAELGAEGLNFWHMEAGIGMEGGTLERFDVVIVHPDAPDSVISAARDFYRDGGGVILAAGLEADGFQGTDGDAGGGSLVRLALGEHPVRFETDTAFGRRVLETVREALPDEVRSRWEALELAPLEYVDPPVPIPAYDGRPDAPRLQEPLGPEASLAHWQVPPGFELQLFAAEPEVVNPIAMAFDERGRLWVAETLDYPNDLRPDGEGNDVIRILEDTDGDGRVDRSTVFAEGLNIPTGMVFANGGLIVAAAPRFLFLADTTGDDRADVREVFMTGWSTRDTHAGPSNLQYGFDNHIWGIVGSAGFSGEVGGRSVQFGTGVFRLPLDASELEFVSGFTNNSWGLGFTEEFHVLGSTANNEHSVHVAVPNRYFAEAAELDGTRVPLGGGRKRLDTHYDIHPLTRDLRQVDYHGGFTSAAGQNLYTARNFPSEYWNRVALVTDPTGHLLHRAVLDRVGSGFRESDGWNLMASPDEWASPVHAQVGPDGAVWVLDWYNFIIQHSPTPPGFETGEGAAYETPLRDRHHGRIYRLVWTGASVEDPPVLDRDDPTGLVDGLRHHNLFWRLTAQRLLVERGEADVLGDLGALVGNPAVDAIGLNGPAVNALWTLHGLGLLEGGSPEAEEVVRGALGHPSPGVRTNAVRVFPRGPGTFDAFRRAGVLDDVLPEVRMAALLALAELPPSEEVGRALYRVGTDPPVLEDEWLPTGLFVASLRHRDGFLAAYGEDIGPVELLRMVGRAARGELDRRIDWAELALDHGDWDRIPVPSLWTETELGHFFGVVWYRLDIDLPDQAAGAPAVLGLGPITDADVTYVNGVRVGTTDNLPGTPRSYEVPEGVLRAGRNVVAVEVTNLRRGGGIWGDPEANYLEVAGSRIPLAGEWRYRIAEEWPGGRAPDFVPGIPFAEQFLRYHNPLGDTGATAPGASDPSVRVDVELELGVIPFENRFDREILSVEAGEQVALRFENTDDMLHNAVVFGGGLELEEIGARLNAYLADPGAVGRDYIPPDVEVIAATAMLGAGESDRVVFTAPTDPGDYLVVCSVPGHWGTMWAVLRVRDG